MTLLSFLLLGLLPVSAGELVTISEEVYHKIPPFQLNVVQDKASGELYHELIQYTTPGQLHRRWDLSMFKTSAFITPPPASFPILYKSHIHENVHRWKFHYMGERAEEREYIYNIHQMIKLSYDWYSALSFYHSLGVAHRDISTRTLYISISPNKRSYQGTLFIPSPSSALRAFHGHVLESSLQGNIIIQGPDTDFPVKNAFQKDTAALGKVIFAFIKNNFLRHSDNYWGELTRNIVEETRLKGEKIHKSLSERIASIKKVLKDSTAVLREWNEDTDLFEVALFRNLLGKDMATVLSWILREDFHLDEYSSFDFCVLLYSLYEQSASRPPSPMQCYNPLDSPGGPEEELLTVMNEPNSFLEGTSLAPQLLNEESTLLAEPENLSTLLKYSKVFESQSFLDEESLIRSYALKPEIPPFRKEVVKALYEETRTSLHKIMTELAPQLRMKSRSSMEDIIFRIFSSLPTGKSHTALTAVTKKYPNAESVEFFSTVTYLRHFPPIPVDDTNLLYFDGGSNYSAFQIYLFSFELLLNKLFEEPLPKVPIHLPIVSIFELHQFFSFWESPLSSLLIKYQHDPELSSFFPAIYKMIEVIFTLFDAFPYRQQHDIYLYMEPIVDTRISLEPRIYPRETPSTVPLILPSLSDDDFSSFSPETTVLCPNRLYFPHRFVSLYTTTEDFFPSQFASEKYLYHQMLRLLRDPFPGQELLQDTCLFQRSFPHLMSLEKNARSDPYSIKHYNSYSSFLRQHYFDLPTLPHLALNPKVFYNRFKDFSLNILGRGKRGILRKTTKSAHLEEINGASAIVNGDVLDALTLRERLQLYDSGCSINVLATQEDWQKSLIHPKQHTGYVKFAMLLSVKLKKGIQYLSDALESFLASPLLTPPSNPLPPYTLLRTAMPRKYKEFVSDDTSLTVESQEKDSSLLLTLSRSSHSVITDFPEDTHIDLRLHLFLLTRDYLTMLSGILSDSQELFRSVEDRLEVIQRERKNILSRLERNSSPFSPTLLQSPNWRHHIHVAIINGDSHITLIKRLLSVDTKEHQPFALLKEEPNWAEEDLSRMEEFIAKSDIVGQLEGINHQEKWLGRIRFYIHTKMRYLKRFIKQFSYFNDLQTCLFKN